MTKTATVSLHGNTYEVDAALVGRRVELVFDPFDLTGITVRYAGRDMGAAVPHTVGRHVHPAAKAPASAQPAPVTGIDYLTLVRHRHTAALTDRVNYAALTDHPRAGDVVLPGQTDLLDLLVPALGDTADHDLQEQK